MSRLANLCIIHGEVEKRIKRAVTEEMQAFLARNTWSNGGGPRFDAVSWRVPSSGVQIFDFALRISGSLNTWIRAEEVEGKPVERTFNEARTIIASVPRHVHKSVYGAMNLVVVYDKNVTLRNMTQPVFEEIA